jgi:hypothetical protein
MLKKFIKVFFFPILIILSVGCANSNLQKTESTSKINDTRQNLRINYFFTSISKSGYYILLTYNNQWEIEKIDDKKITRNNEKQEVLFLNDDMTEIGPIFEETAPRAGNTFECSVFGEEVYNPCNSNLMTTNIGKSIAKNVFSAALTFGLASGSHKSIDSDKIKKIINDTNLMSKIDEARIIQAKMNYFYSQIKVLPNIVDKSGFYKNEKLFKLAASTTADRLYPNLDLNSVKYNLNINPSSHDYKMEITPNNYIQSFNDTTPLKPKIEIFTKKFLNYYPKNFTSANKDIKLNFEGKNDITFTNLSNDYITIKSISLYFNEKVTNFQLKQQIELAPNMNYIYQINIINEISKNYELTKEEARNLNIEFGFAIKYTNNTNNENTLYKTKRYTLLDLIEI